jgi:hypothetical protein
MSECVGNALFTQVNADFDRSWNFQRGKPPIDCRPVKMAGEKFSVCRGVASPGVRPPNKNNSTGRLHANFVGFAKNLTERKDLRARKNHDSLTPTSAILSVYAAAQSASTIPEKSIAVLPFENRSQEKANAYFADGIQDEILTRLSKIADLKVISRTSTQHYKKRAGKPA